MKKSHVSGEIPIKAGIEDLYTEKRIKINKLGLNSKDDIFD